MYAGGRLSGISSEYVFEITLRRALAVSCSVRASHAPGGLLKLYGNFGRFLQARLR